MCCRCCEQKKKKKKKSDVLRDEFVVVVEAMTGFELEVYCCNGGEWGGLLRRVAAV